MKICRWLLAFSLLLSLSPVRAEPDDWLQRDAHYTALFDRKEGWLGADGAYSLPLDGRVLWLFSDTLVGNAGRIDMPHNTVALEESGNIRFFPTQVFTPPDGKGWFWVYQGFPAASEECWVFLGQFDETPGPEGFNFKFAGSWLARLRVPYGGSPEVAEYQALPHWTTFAEGKADIHFGTALLAQGGFLYIYGTADRGGFDKQLLLARAPIDSWRDASSWAYYGGQESWVSDASQARPLTLRGENLKVSNELSVFSQDGKISLLTQNVSDINLYGAAQPWGPFLTARKLATISEKGEGVMTYNAKAHPHLRNAQGEMLITYNRNAFPVQLVKDNPALYRPQFFRLRSSAR